MIIKVIIIITILYYRNYIITKHHTFTSRTVAGLISRGPPPKGFCTPFVWPTLPWWPIFDPANEICATQYRTLSETLRMSSEDLPNALGGADWAEPVEPDHSKHPLSKVSLGSQYWSTYLFSGSTGFRLVDDGVGYRENCFTTVPCSESWKPVQCASLNGVTNANNYNLRQTVVLWYRNTERCWCVCDSSIFVFVFFCFLLYFF